MKNYTLASEWSLRIAIGIMYLYSGLDLITHPGDWEVFLPDWLYRILDTWKMTLPFLQVQGAAEVLAGIIFLLFLSPRWLVIAAAIFTAIEMILILAFLGIDKITFRDMGLIGASLSLAIMQYAKIKQPLKQNVQVLKMIPWFALALVVCSALPVFASEPLDPATLTRRKCSSCHAVPKPGRYTEEELISAVQKHTKQLRSVSEEDQKRIIDYLKQTP